jgi:hypothetical protein
LLRTGFFRQVRELKIQRKNPGSALHNLKNLFKKRRVALSRSKSLFHTVPKSLIQPLAQAKNADEQFWKERFHAANGKAQHALIMGPGFFFLGGGWVMKMFYEILKKMNSQVIDFFIK